MAGYVPSDLCGAANLPAKASRVKTSSTDTIPMTPDMVLPRPASISTISRPTKRSRSKNGQRGSSPQLAEDVLVEIFAQLPAKSVGRCRCLSRSWAATLSSASFADLHLERANDSQRKQERPAAGLGAPPKLFFTTAPRRLRAWQHAPPPVLRELTGDALRVLPQQPDRGSYSQVVVSRPCHGLVLLLRWPCHGHHVCNPSTGALLPLPDTKTPSRMCGRDGLPGTRANSVSYGLGYDPATKEHKVVRLFYLREEDAPPVTACEVFSTGRASTSVHWRPAAQRPPPCTTLSPWTRAAAVFFGGRLHFLQHGGECSIVTFDVGHETFGSLAPPPGLDHVAFDLAVLDGGLCLHYGLYGYRRGDGNGGYYIWRLRSSDGAGAGAGQWEQLYHIQQQTWPQDLLNLDLDQISPLEIYHDRNDGHKKIMFATTVLTVFTVDVHLAGGGAPEILLSPPTGSFTKHGGLYTNAVGLLQESLVSVGRPSEEIIFSSPPMKAWSHVLKWLPTHTVAPLTRVCKAWRAMIKSDRFIQVHANMGKKPPRLTLIAASHGIFWPLEEGRDREIQQYEMSKFLFAGCGSRVVCSKPCHGLVVGSCTDERQTSWDFVCNPTMGYYKQLHLDPDGDATFLDGRIGLGYDSRVNKHVLVRLVYYRERDLNSWDYHLGCYVRHMDTEMWRAIKPPPRPAAEMQSIHVDGKLYWMVDPDLGTEFSSGCQMLVLDISSEEFSVLEGPECYYDQVKSIVELQGNVCVMCSDDVRNAMDIWMLEGGVWSIWCRIELEELSAEYSEETVVLEVDPTDGRLLLSTGKVIGYYDPVTRTIETIHRLVGHLHALKFAPVLCQESLISPYVRVETAMLL